MTFSIHFLLCNLVIAVLAGMLLLLKRIFKKYLTADSRYHMWYIFTAALFLPFLPESLTQNDWMQDLFYNASAALITAPVEADHIASSTSSASASSVPSLGLYDLAEAVRSTDFSDFSRIFTLFWLAGCALTVLYYLLQIYRIHRIRKSGYAVTPETEPELYDLFLSCRKELKIRRRVSLYTSCSLTSPVSYGLLFPTVIIPQDLDILLDPRDLRFIFLHELQHCRQKDAVLNNLSCFFQIIYWFNPLVWYCFAVMRCDRETACDHAVIRTVGKEHAAGYGYTLIRYAENLGRKSFLSPLSLLGGEKEAVMRRIREIAGYRADTPLNKARSICILLMSALFVCTAAPFLSVRTFGAASDSYADVPAEAPGKSYEENTEYVDLSRYFHGLEGTFVLYDMTDRHFRIYNEELSTRRVSPDSTFKIYSALFALEKGIISPDSTALPWDGTEYNFDSWNRDQTLESAMQNSVNWYFQELDRLTGYSALSDYYREISYGNCNLTGGIDTYWAESSLKISPVEQVLLLADLLQNKWGFADENIRAVRDALFISETTVGKLYGKTGTGSVNGQNVNGWFVGFLENDGHMCCFAVNVQSGADTDSSAAGNISGSTGGENVSGSSAAKIALEILAAE
ncbi:hypothetical protein B5F07_17740 [Lachnoclostridium sp. An169]|uniref:BlaR1 family beta-lactam sensor/signal transducer n=1 Tax=Lachnoclostridium sp. An169 TaxID=1965569 RepID=UPI000B3981D2|nr:BlaR1 family beta-lactam sensor/signal transducer [Lachnoclostridium sp. An169]OUP81422.1 hypothetical protein B5F07_17740 [Lachnoclostridium sp. An169]